MSSVELFYGKVSVELFNDKKQVIFFKNSTLFSKCAVLARNFHYRIENFEFIVSERVQVNPDN